MLATAFGKGRKSPRRFDRLLYRKRPSGRVFCVTVLLILAGLAGLTWPLWPDEWTSITAVWAAVLGRDCRASASPRLSDVPRRRIRTG